MLEVLPCADDDARAAKARRDLSIPRDVAVAYAAEAVRIAQEGAYRAPSGRRVDVSADVARAVAAKVSIPPDHPLAAPGPARGVTRVQVAQETTLQAARRLVDAGHRALALNFANGVHPGGGFLHGARAQEESLCRSSALWATLRDDPMYDAHDEGVPYASSDWCILSPDVPVFRDDAGDLLEAPWTVAFLTCAAPMADRVGVDEASRLMGSRVRRVIDVARAWGYDALVLGAWGCGAFENDPRAVATHFRAALDAHAGAFSEVVFAITDWSPERRFLGPFRDAF